LEHELDGRSILIIEDARVVEGAHEIYQKHRRILIQESLPEDEVTVTPIRRNGLIVLVNGALILKGQIPLIKCVFIDAHVAPGLPGTLLTLSFKMKPYHFDGRKK
jgi:hypothetical protein